MNFRESRWGSLRRAFRLPPSARQIDADVGDEFRFHIEGRVEQFMHEGMTRPEAEHEVQRRFGDYNTHRQSVRDIDGTAMRRRRVREFVAMLANELRQAPRALVRTPVFTSVAIITLALGIGATTAIFTVLDAVVLRPLPYRNSAALVSVLHPATVPGSGERKWGLSEGGYFQFRARNKTLKNLGMYRTGDITVTNNNRADVARVGIVTASIFPTLEARAELGRLLNENDDRFDGPMVAVLSHEYFERRFGGDSSMIGRNLATDRGPVQVVGVAEPGLTLPMPGPFASQTNLAGNAVDVWLPMQLNSAGPFYNSHPNVGIGRLRDGVSVERAQKDFAGIMQNFTTVLPLAYSTKFLKGYNFRVEVSDLRNAVLGAKIPQSLWMVLGSVVLLLLIAVANVANLFIVRMETRRRESAIRTALGASTAQMAAHFLSESLLICVGAAGAGIAFAYGAVRALLLIAPASIPRLTALSMSASSLVVAFGLALSIGIALGVMPLFRKFSANAIREGGRGLSASLRQRFVRNALVIGQVSLALVLAAGAALMGKSFNHLQNVRPGFDATNVQAFNISLPFVEFDTRDKAYAFHRELERQIAEIPGVTSVGAAGAMPLEDFGTGCTVLYHEGSYDAGEKTPCVPNAGLAPGFFETLRMSVEGRAPNWDDIHEHLQTAVVTKPLADRMWPGVNPIGQRLSRNGPRGKFWYTVVGVVSGLRAEALENPPTEAVFVQDVGFEPNQQSDGANDFVYFVRTRDALTPALMKSIVALTAKLNPRVPIVEARTMSQVVARSTSRTSFIMILLGIAASVALVLSAVGMYGVISYVVAQRRNEIGIRIALGAEVHGIARLIMLQSMRTAAAGVAIGLLLAFGTGHVLASLLFEVSPADPVTLGGVALLLLIVAAFASFAPARRAAAIDPLEAMRAD
jgi:putative ABC transport system permease protein